jgi:hypothetical protein
MNAYVLGCDSVPLYAVMGDRAFADKKLMDL